MTDTVKNISQRLIEILKIPAIIIGSISSIIIAYRYFENLTDRVIAIGDQNKKEVKQEIKVFKNTVNLQFIEVRNDIKQVRDSLAVINYTTRRNAGEFFVLKNAFTDEFAKDNPAEKVLQLMREFETAIQSDVEIIIQKKDGQKN